jgi:hypothetical protein
MKNRLWMALSALRSPLAIDRGDFWEFKARTAALDLEAAKLRSALTAVSMRKNALIDAFAARHGLDPRRPIVFEDTDCTIRQEGQ